MDRSGAPLAVWDLIQGLSHDYEISLATGPTADPGQDLAQEISTAGFPVFQVPVLCRDVHLLRDIAALWELVRIIGKDRYDLVHCHKSKAGFLGRLAGGLCGVKVVYTPHGNVLEGYFGPAKTWLFARVDGLTAPFLDRIVSLTPAEIAEYLREGIGRPSQHQFIYNGIDVDAFDPSRTDREEVRRGIGVDQDAFLIASVGRLEPVKGHFHLIDALPDVIRRHPHTILALVGDGELLRDLKDRARSLGLADRVRFPGHRKDVAGILAAADLFVLPSLNEGFGLALLEAMAAGLATVASRVGGVPEVVSEGETGILVPPAEPHALADAVLRLMGDPEGRTRMGTAGRERARQCFSIERTVRQTDRLYRELINA